MMASLDGDERGEDSSFLIHRGVMKRKEEERFLSAQADLLQEQEARKSRPAPFEMTGCGGGE
jgi:hypothetical protein